MKTRQQAAKRVQGRPNRGSRSRPTASTTEGTEGLGRGTRRAADLNRLRRDDPSFARRRRVDDTGGEAEQTRSQGVRARDEGEGGGAGLSTATPYLATNKVKTKNPAQRPHARLWCHMSNG